MAVTMKTHHLSLAGLASSLVLLSSCQLPNECTEASSCRASYGPANFCAEDGICEPFAQDAYLTGPCTEVSGDVFAKDAFNVGVVLALNEQADYYGLIKPIADAITLAQEDINEINGVNGKQINLVFCNTDGDAAQAAQAAQHLADIGIQAVVGPDFSGYTVNIVPEVFVPNGILAVSPSATAPAISGLNDQGLMWRTVPSDVIQGQTLAELTAHVATNVVTPRGSAIKVAVLARESDAYADGLLSSLSEFLPNELLSAEVYTVVEYPNAGEGGGSDYTSAVLQAAESKPDVVVALGLAEVWDIIGQMDIALQEDYGYDHTIFITADGGKDSLKAATALQTRPGLEGRVWGTAPRSLRAEEYVPYRKFSLKWRSTYNSEADTFPFISNGYDALYLIAFAFAAAGEADGLAMSKAMTRLTRPGGVVIEANQQDFQQGVTALSQGQSIDFEGASGPIEFDANGDPKSATIALWCLDSDGDGALSEPGDLKAANDPTFNPLRCDYTVDDPNSE